MNYLVKKTESYEENSYKTKDKTEPMAKEKKSQFFSLLTCTDNISSKGEKTF